MKVRSAIIKGRKFQKDIASIILGHLSGAGFDFDETDIHPAIGAQHGSDIILTSRVQQVFPFDVECKKQKKVDLFSAYRQAVSRSRTGVFPLIVAAENNSKPCVFFMMDGRSYYHTLTTSDVTVSFEWGDKEEMTPYRMWIEDERHNKGGVIIRCTKDGSSFLLTDFNVWIERYVSDIRTLL